MYFFSRGTKYSRFPNWLDRWLRMRKELGLLMMFFASIHACAYCLVFTRAKGSTPFPEPNFENQTVDWDTEVEVIPTLKDMSFKQNFYLCCGVLAYAFTVILGITSLPSVSSSLSWREFRLIQSKLGWLCLVLAFVHCLVESLPDGTFGFSCGVFPGSNNIAMWPAYVTIGLKIPLILMDRRLTRIRKGRDVSGMCCC